jgi:signal transduction histidine kinase
MIQQILTFARGLGGTPTLLDAKQLVAEMAKLIRQAFPASIQLEVKASEPLYPILGNATQLHQVLLNLCVNARDAMPSGGTLVLEAENCVLNANTTRWQEEPVSGPHLMLAVADTGQGIAPEVVDQIFEPFFTTKESGKGTGLGLSTVLGIVKSHSGFVDVASQVGKGTTFRVYLPAHRGGKS